MKLDLGAGGRPREGFLGVDRVKVTPETIECDLVSGSRWPWNDDSIEALCSSHFIEHIPADEIEVHRYVGRQPSGVRRFMQDRLLFFFDEAFRVIKPGGLFYLTWPNLKSSDAFRDPTHRRFLPLEFLHYLSNEGRASMGLEHYEVSCNWVTQGDAICSTEPRPEGSEPFTPSDLNRLWDVGRAWTVALRAEKS